MPAGTKFDPMVVMGPPISYLGLDEEPNEGDLDKYAETRAIGDEESFMSWILRLYFFLLFFFHHHV